MRGISFYVFFAWMGLCFHWGSAWYWYVIGLVACWAAFVWEAHLYDKVNRPK
jgi:hypothetical protein